MRVLVTGSAGIVGRVAVSRLARAGHEVIGTDVVAPSRPPSGQAGFILADLTDPGDAYAVIGGFDAVVHTAAIPRAGAHPGHTVFATNTLATFNCVEAALRSDIAAHRQRLLRGGGRTLLRRTGVRPPVPPRRREPSAPARRSLRPLQGVR